MINLKNNIIKIFIAMLVIIAFMYPTSVNASNVQILSPGGTNNTTPTVNTTPSPKATPVASPKTTPSPIAQSKLPQTGIEDYTGLIIVTIVLGGSAIYAYRKMKYYDKV